MKTVMATALLIATTGCAMAQAAAERAQEALTTCLIRSAAELDDGASDVRSVAAAAVSECNTERRALLRTGGRTSDADLDRYMISTREVALDRATVAVLRVRKERKARR